MSATLHGVGVLALGARTPVGLSAESTAAAVRAGISGHTRHPFMVDHNGDEMCCAGDSRLPAALLGWRRLAALAASALDEVLGKLAGRGTRPEPTTLLLTLPERRPGFGEREADEVVASLQAHAANRAGEGIKLRIQKSAGGHAGGLQAMSMAAERITGGAANLCIVGGVDSYFDGDTIDWLIQQRRLNGEGIRNGFIPGEGASFLALASVDLRRKLRLPPLGWVRGAGVAMEVKLIGREEVNLGEHLAEAIEDAARRLRLPDEAVDAVYCDINGERYRSEEWGFALLRMPQVCRDISYESPAGCLGDVGAASGPLLCTLAVQSWARRYALGPRALLWSGSEAGLRAAVVLEAPPSGHKGGKLLG